MRTLLIALLAVLAACGSDEPPWPDIGEPFPNDAWLRTEWERSFTRDHQRPPTSYRLVPEAELAAALGMLKEESYVMLTPEAAARFGSGELSPTAPSDVPVLLRALLIGGESGLEKPEGVPGLDLDVMWSKGAACVSVFTYRDRHCPHVRSAVLAWLPEAPSEVCVRAAAAIYGGVR